MPLQPSRRDSANPQAFIRHHESYLRGLDPGFLGGRFTTPQQFTPGPSELVGGDEGGEGEDTGYEWEWDDRHAVTSTGTQSPVLSKVPVEESLTVMWHPDGRGGYPLTNDQFIVSGQTVIIADPGILAIDDEFSFQYQFDTGLADDLPTFRGAAPQALNGFVLPPDAVIGDFLVALAMIPNTEGATVLNGWTLEGASANVTHSAVGGGIHTYRLEVYTFINDGVTVPTVATSAAEDIVCSMAAFIDGGSCVIDFDTLADGTTAYAPAMTAPALRVWGTIGDTVAITPQRGEVILNTNYVEIDTAMTIDADPTAAPATTSGAAGWCLASIRVEAPV